MLTGKSNYLLFCYFKLYNFSRYLPISFLKKLEEYSLAVTTYNGYILFYILYQILNNHIIKTYDKI